MGETCFTRFLISRLAAWSSSAFLLRRSRDKTCYTSHTHKFDTNNTSLHLLLHCM